jgi:DNA-binding GntR family transcriptional regulator
MVSRKEMMASIRARVESGEWGPGAKLPSTRELMVEFDVSESTVLSAMQLLEAEGLIVNRWGAGRFVPGSGAPNEEPGEGSP